MRVLSAMALLIAIPLMIPAAISPAIAKSTDTADPNQKNWAQPMMRLRPGGWPAMHGGLGLGMAGLRINDIAALQSAAA